MNLPVISQLSEEQILYVSCFCMTSKAVHVTKPKYFDRENPQVRAQHLVSIRISLCPIRNFVSYPSTNQAQTSQLGDQTRSNAFRVVWL
jgi:hypothetical protein